MSTSCFKAHKSVCVCVSVQINKVCLCVCESSSRSEPRYCFHITKRALVFVVVYFQAGKVSHSYNMATFPLFIVNVAKRGGRGARNFFFVSFVVFFKNAHRLIYRFTSRAAPGLCYVSYTGKKKKKRRFNYFGIDALVTKYRPFYSFLFSLMFSFACVISPSPLNPDHVCVSQYRKKGRFVVVLPSHLRCSPFKRHRLFYKLCDCE